MEARSVPRTRGPGRLSAHPSAATRHRACHDVGPVTPISHRLPLAGQPVPGGKWGSGRSLTSFHLGPFRGRPLVGRWELRRGPFTVASSTRTRFVLSLAAPTGDRSLLVTDSGRCLGWKLSTTSKR